MHPVLPSRPQTGARSSRSSSSPSLSLGHMTAAMRAVALRPDATKRALRVGLLRDGRVLEERLVTHGTLTVGDAEDASFVIAGVRGKHRLFAEKDGRFTLAPLPGMRGRIATDDGVHDGALHGAMVLDPRTRGRLTLGDATLLFQMVDAPTKAPRPMLPSSVKTSLMDIVDWPLTILVAMSFLVHFGVVGAMYSDWTDRIVDESFVVQGLVDLNRALPPPLVEEPETVTHEAAPAPSAPAPVYAAPNRPSRTSDARPVKDPTAGLVEAAERMRLDLLATTAPGSAVDDALRRSNIPAISLTQAQADAPLTNERELTLHSTGPIDPSLRRTDLSTVVTNTHKDGNDHVAVRDTPGPQYSLDAHPVQTTTHVSNAERTISSLRAGFRRCYEQGLQKDPQMSGDVTIRAHIRSTGEVDSTAITAQNGLSPEVAACIVRKVASAEFDKPEGGSATIDIPVKFVKQR